MTKLTEEDIAKLEPRAMVALAARCAERVLKFVDESELEQKHKDAVDNAIQVATDTANDTATRDAATAANAATAARSAATRSSAATYAAATAAAYAAYAARSAATSSSATARAATVAAATARDAARDATANAVRVDYQYLMAHGHNFKYEDLGPLWPDGAPWDEDLAFPRLDVDLLLSNGVTDEELKTIASRVAVALNEVFENENAGGVELEIIELFDFEEVAV